MRKPLLAFASILLLGNAALAAPPLTEPVDTNVINTVDTNVVTTLSADQLNGVGFFGQATDVYVVFYYPVLVHAVSTSTAPVNAGDVCNISAGMKSYVSATDYKPIGLSAMSNGQAATASQTYEIPIEGVEEMHFGVSATGGSCYVSLSLSYSEIALSPTDSTSSMQSFEVTRQPRIEFR